MATNPFGDFDMTTALGEEVARISNRPPVAYRAYICIYARGADGKMPGGEDAYHWAIAVYPSTEHHPELEHEDDGGVLFHAKENLISDGRHLAPTWQFEERTSPMSAGAMLLARFHFADVADVGQFVTIMYSTDVPFSQPGWNQVSWVKAALQELQEDGLVLEASVTDWTTIRDTIMTYIEVKKEQHRYDGRGWFDQTRVATYSLLELSEVVF